MTDETKNETKLNDKDPLSGLKFQLPDWFLTDYVKTSTEIGELDSKISVVKEISAAKEKAAAKKTTSDSKSSPDKDGKKDNAPIDKFEVPEKTYAEMRDTAAFGLIAKGTPTPKLDPQDASIVMESTSAPYCNHVVQHLAKEFGAHLVVINMDVLSELATEFDRQELEWLANKPKEEEGQQTEEIAKSNEEEGEGSNEDTTEGDGEEATDKNEENKKAEDKEDEAGEPAVDEKPLSNDETSEAQPSDTVEDDGQEDTENTQEDDAVIGTSVDNGITQEDSLEDGTITPSEEWIMTENLQEEHEQQEGSQGNTANCDEPPKDASLDGTTGGTPADKETPPENDAEHKKVEEPQTTQDISQEEITNAESETAEERDEEEQKDTESAEENEDTSSEANEDVEDGDSDELSDDVADPSSRNHSEIQLDAKYSTADSLAEYYFSARCKKHSPRDVFSRTRRAIKTILKAPNAKLNNSMKLSLASDASSIEEASDERVPPIFILIEDAFDIRFKSRGQKMLKNMHAVIQRQRENSSPALIFAVTSKSSSKVVKKLKTDTDLQDLNPACLEKYEATFKEEIARRVTNTNIKRMKFDLRKNFPEDFCPEFMSLETRWDLTNLGKEALSTSQLKRIVKQATGHGLLANQLDLAAIQEIVTRVIGEEEKSEENEDKVPSIVDRIREDCSEDEEKLLDRVIDKDKMTVTFDDVIMDEEAKKAIKYLVSISKIRFEGASKELLDRCNINGALLYGPPGTGKTHLAHAIAKHSGSNMLAVSGADLESKWVGETEQAIQAAFSLAKKLSPCVLFIDEADAMLHRRTCDERSYVRKALNQFLQEMDGITSDNSSTFILCATNRPMDIDEAFLRRLPHKVMLSLPDQTQRRAILDVLLKGPDLLQSVDLDAIARDTKGYSGSDLRSICGEAALMFAMEKADISDEADEKGDPVQLRLESRHFSKAMKKIMPSVSNRSLGNMDTFTRTFNRF